MGAAVLGSSLRRASRHSRDEIANVTVSPDRLHHPTVAVPSNWFDVVSEPATHLGGGERETGVSGRPFPMPYHYPTCPC